MRIEDPQDLQGLEIKTMNQVLENARECNKPNFRIYQDFESDLIKKGVAPSFTAWLLNEYQIKDRPINELAQEIGLAPITLSRFMDRLGVPKKEAKEYLRPIVNTEQTRKKISSAKLSPITREEIEKKYIVEKKSPTRIAKELHAAPERIKGLIQEYGFPPRTAQESMKLSRNTEEWKKRNSQMHRKLYAEPEQLYDLNWKQDKTLGEIAQIYQVSATTIKNWLEKYGYGVKPVTNKGKRFVFSEKHRENLGRAHAGIPSPLRGIKRSKETIEKVIESRRDSDLRARFFLEGNLYDSRTEGAVALLMEKYIPGFKIRPKETFQANGDTLCIFDFILPDAIVEWHPITPRFDAEAKDFAVYKELMEQEKNPKVRAQFEKEFKQELAVNYWIQRQAASDGSEIYAGKEVVLATNFREFYRDILLRYGQNIPDAYTVAKEYSKLTNASEKRSKGKKIAGAAA